MSGLHRERTSTRCTDFQHAYGVLVVVTVVVIIIVQIYRTRRSHENHSTSAYERKNKNKNRCRVYTHCSCCVEKNTPLHTKRNCARKTFKHTFSLQQDEITLYIFNTSRTVFTARNKQKLRTPSGNPFKCHEEVLFLQPMIPHKRFDFFPLTGGCSEGLRAFRFFLKQLIAIPQTF